MRVHTWVAVRKVGQAILLGETSRGPVFVSKALRRLCDYAALC